jgi:hypothetical protein
MKDYEDGKSRLSLNRGKLILMEKVFLDEVFHKNCCGNLFE